MYVTHQGKVWDACRCFGCDQHVKVEIRIANSALASASMFCERCPSEIFVIFQDELLLDSLCYGFVTLHGE